MKRIILSGLFTVCLLLSGYSQAYTLTGMVVNGGNVSVDFNNLVTLQAGSRIQFIGNSIPNSTINIGIENPIEMQSHLVQVTTDGNGNFFYPSAFGAYTLSSDRIYSFLFDNGQYATITTLSFTYSNSVVGNINYSAIELTDKINFDQIEIDYDLIESMRFRQNYYNGETVSNFDMDAVSRGFQKESDYAERHFIENYGSKYDAVKPYWEGIVYAQQAVVCAAGLAAAAGTGGAGTPVAVLACAPLVAHIVRDIDHIIIDNYEESGKLSPEAAQIWRGTTNLLYGTVSIISFDPNGAATTLINPGIDMAIDVADMTETIFTGTAQLIDGVKEIDPNGQEYLRTTWQYSPTEVATVIILPNSDEVNYQESTLSSGVVSPVVGSTVDNFDFTVLYQNQSNTAPASIAVNIDGVNHSMSTSGINFSNGETFSYSTSFSAAGAKDYYFLATTQDGQILRFPESGYLTCTVLQSADGHDIEVVGYQTKYSPTSPNAGTYIDVNVAIRNLGTSVESGIPIQVELRGPSGNLLDNDNTTSGTMQMNIIYNETLTVRVPSGAENGTYSIYCTVLPGLDNDPSNNSYTMKFNIGVNLPNDQCKTPGQTQMVREDIITLNNLDYELFGINITSQLYAGFIGPYGDLETIHQGELHIYGSDDACLAVDVIYAISSVGYVAVLGGEITDQGMPFYPANRMHAYPGQSIIFSATSPSGLQFGDRDYNHEIWMTSVPNTLEDWYSGVVSNDGFYSAEFEFRIPSNASYGEHTFYFANEYENTSRVDFTRLTIDVVAPPPTISSLSSYQFSADDFISIYGLNLGSSGTISFGNVQANQLSSWSSSSITCEVPEGITNGTVTVTANGSTSNGIAYQVTSSTGDPQFVYHVPDMSIGLDESIFIGDLNNFVVDPNNDVLQFNAYTNSQDLLVDPTSMQSNLLYINSNNLFEGEAIVTIEATDADNITISDNFIVTAIKVNNPPEVVNPISNREVDEHFATFQINLSSVFSDANGDILVMTAVSSNMNVVTASISGSTLTISEVGLGVSTITITATDLEKSVADQFTVTVNNVNDAPELNTPISDLQLNEETPNASIGLSNVFFDPDGDILVYSSSSSNPAIATATISANTLNVSGLSEGTSEISVIASDGVFTATDIFTVSYQGSSHFTPAWYPENGVDHMNFYVTSAMLDGEYLEAGDEIAIYDGDICVGAGRVSNLLDGSGTYLQIIVSANYAAAPDINGYTAGSAARFVVWDASLQMEYSTVSTNYITGDELFSIGATSTLTIEALSSIDQSIPLMAGWNIFSIASYPENPDMLSVVQQLISGGSLAKIQDEQGNAVEYLDFLSSWVNNIGNISPTEGYKIRVIQNADLQVSGVPIALPFGIPLAQGWNISGYPSTTAENSEDVVAELISHNSLVKTQNQAGEAIEYLAFLNSWVYGFNTFEPGQGYKINTSQNDIFTIRDMAKKVTFEKVDRPDNMHYAHPWIGNGLDHMNIYIVYGQGLVAGDEIGIFDGDVCVGSAVVDDMTYLSIPVSWDDPETDFKDGYEVGNSIGIKVWKSDSNIEYQVDEIDFSENSTSHFEKMATSVINLELSTILGNLETMIKLTSLGDAYPNPFNSESIISFELGSTMNVRIEIYNLLGEKVRTLIDQELESGSHQVVWKSSNDIGRSVGAGVYMYRMTTKDLTLSKYFIHMNH